ncbi:MAG: PEP-CTERM system histidine kinase PrsK [Deltaproteobacteria bacterium]|nr:PEP-CTERM system histidine kinase PrsK [Deltaproteobacteria bacterium]
MTGMKLICYLPAFAGFLAFWGIGGYVFLRRRGSPVNLLFALGMGFLGLLEFGNLMSLMYLERSTRLVLAWNRVSLAAESLLPGTWFAFVMAFAREGDRYGGKGWKAAATVFLGGSVFFAVSAIFGLLGVFAGDHPAYLTLGTAGKAFYVFVLTGSVGVVVGLEHTVRRSGGVQRSRIRTFCLGLGGLFAFLVYGASQVLLFSRINLRMIPLESSVFVICALMIGFSLVRHRLMEADLYVSRFVVYNSFTVLVAGGYLVAVASLGQGVRFFDIVPGYPLEILFLFPAVLLLAVLLLSDRLRSKARTMINRHFYRSRYDYREEWLRFSERLSLNLELEKLVSTIVDVLRDSVGVREASLWLLEEPPDGTMVPVGPGASGRKDGKKDRLRADQDFLRRLEEKRAPFAPVAPWARGFAAANREILSRLNPSLIVPMVSRRGAVGLIFLGEKTTGEPFLADDLDLLRSAGAQIASAVVNAKLSEELVMAREMEVFYRLSSFVLHDLKNLVSSLSLVLENAGEHMGDPEFREDALQTIGRSVEKMKALMGRLSGNGGGLRPNLQETSLNGVVLEVAGRLARRGGNGRVKVKTDLAEIPRVMADREQMERVVLNLLVNAFDALEAGGTITVRTRLLDGDGKVVLSVSDDGPGIPREVAEKLLFRPFGSTKKEGLGIGLYQCKTVVEAHHGTIEVESEEGKGSTFRVILPALSPGPALSFENRLEVATS